MKTNEAPEKIYLFENPITEEPDDRWLSRKSEDRDIEYIRTDAFIEKATLWLLTNASDYCTLHNSYDTKELVENFVDAMKGE